MINRRIFCMSLAASVASSAAFSIAGPSPIRAQVFRSPDCGCCGAWIAHLEENGFVVDVVMSSDVEAVKDRHNVPAALRSCHTALIEGYVIEGHVPAADIRRLVDLRPDAVGLTVPGMPVGSPGMEMGDQVDPYDVILWSGSETRIFASHPG